MNMIRVILQQVKVETHLVNNNNNKEEDNQVVVKE